MHPIKHPLVRSTVFAALACVALTAAFVACATSGTHTKAEHPQAQYEGKCAFLALDAVDAPDDTSGDSTSLVATYRFGQAAADRNDTIALGFRVARSRVDDLRAHLQAHPTVLCRPDPEGLFGGAAALHVPPFEGQKGALLPKPASGAKASTKPGTPPDSEHLEDYMFAHFAIVTWGRDAVINGELEALRDPMNALARYDYAKIAPGGWMANVAQIQETAKLTASATSLEHAASGIAALARACGDCHQQKGKGPKFDLVAAEKAGANATAVDTFRERMQRHIWATDRMWEGVTGPSDSAWNAGAHALVNLPTEIPSSRPVAPAVIAALLRVRELGTSAEEATTPSQRADVYGELLGTCASCHAQRAELGF